MYVCGPTVYNFIHIGNARPLVFFDVARRFLEHQGYSVRHVINYTDIDDKIIHKAQQENRPWFEITAQFIREYETDMELLKVRHPHAMPKVSDFIPEIIQLVQRLIDKGFAYEKGGEVFYRVRHFKGYGKLSGKDLDSLRAGARVEVDREKEDPLDFTLWKPRKEASEPAWESPWGSGRPGWHIECSAMAMKLLGESFDIHGGGMDLMHPHHENEIAQSEAVTEKTFAKYWLHNNMLNINAEKMSKSLGNIRLARELIEENTAEVVKLALLSGHYRSVIDFSDKLLRDCLVSLHRFYSTLARVKEVVQGLSAEGFNDVFQKQWEEALTDDFNTPKVLAHVFDYLRFINGLLDVKPFRLNDETKKQCLWFVDAFSRLSKVLNLFGEEPSQFLSELKIKYLKNNQMNEGWIQSKILERNTARKNKDFKLADGIRDELLQKGIELKDGKEVTVWDVKL